MNRIDVLKTTILKSKAARRIRIDGRRVLVDPPTARACVQVHDGLNAHNQARFNSMPWDECMELAWRLTLRPGNGVRV